MSKPSLLVVDDDRTTLAFLKGMLQGEGYAVTTARSGTEALAMLFSGEAYDTVLLDRRMPDMDGLEVLRRMKVHTDLREVPVIFQTGMDDPTEIEEGLKSGAFYYLLKPLDPRYVIQVVAAARSDLALRRQFWSEMEGVRSAFSLIQRGRFRFQTLEQCFQLAPLLAKACADPRRTTLGLSELMVNALEHGNLGISYSEKTRLIDDQAWLSEVERRQDLPENRGKWVTVSLVHLGPCVRFRICDAGPGFPWRDFQRFDPERLSDNHGRGILLAKYEAFERLDYLGTGNCVLAETRAETWNSLGPEPCR